MPWMHIKVVVTSTDWANWFALRDHPDADPTIEALAQAMDIAMRESKPKTLQQGEWHLPYIYEHERNLGVSIEQLLRSSAARCARVSYLNFDGSLNFNKDNKLFAQLVESKPVHASPTEHQATPDRIGLGNLWAAPEKHGNFFGWCQHRKMIEGEAVHDR
jgi:thymidylate synthase ThyX